MTVAVWPSELPPPEQQGYKKTAQDPRQKRAGDIGPAGYRRRFSGVARPVSLSFLLDRGQKARFDRFYEEETGFGTISFDMPDPTTDGWPALDSNGEQMLDSEGRPMLLTRIWRCKFADGAPEETVVDTQFRVTFSILVMP
ncbi:hypothetical protein [Rhizobium sp. CSW-27]|uniref:hypothetical protein n=1 Tax=Rhizobium sp. CSW-27 TaxID=2839985 RepID=UPI001C00FAE9|nr:hypothetical protein [Rhizobium sp. CSW-27]MBT9370270.1 hypothetical protein [Rhizobium sp. CSW-27]